ncbi:MAG: hypothetical protein RMA76_10795 [Deltaproteobacteria bacterium]
MIKLSPSAMTWWPDLVDHVLPDSVRAGDAFDVLSGRFAIQTWAQLNPLVEVGDAIGVRRARDQDLTSSGLGFEMMISHQGDFSNALVHLPAADDPVWQTGKLPVVIDAHGFSDAPRAHSKRSKISQAAVEGGAVAVALGGSRHLEGAPILLVRSHDGMDSQPGKPMKPTDGPEQIRFVLSELEAKVNDFAARNGLPSVKLDVDEAVIDGFSNGGALTAIAVASGAAKHGVSFSGPTSPQIRDLVPPGPVNMIFVAGENDPLVPPQGRTGPMQADFLAPAEAAQIFADHNGTGPLSGDDLPPFLAKLVQPGVTVTATGDREKGLVAYVHVEGMGHAVPGSDPMISKDVDPRMRLHSSDKFSGAELVQDFASWVRS